jgi:hypothetical protein
VDKVQTPMLMEFVAGNAVSGFEFYVPLREAKVPAEMVLYDREAHNFVRPTVRFASMHRKVDWLDFWLLDKEDADPAKAAQYTRWKQLKTEWKR